MTTYIVTHVNGDLDSIGFAWLAQKLAKQMWGTTGQLLFFPAAMSFEKIIESVSVINKWPGLNLIVGDIGRQSSFNKSGDGTIIAVDHHHIDDKSLSATLMIWQTFLKMSDRKKQWLLDIKPLVDLITDGDWMSGERQAMSRQLGLHAKLDAIKARGERDDQTLFDTIAADLELIAEGLHARATAARELPSWTEWSAMDKGYQWLCLKPGAPRVYTITAYDAGFDIVFFDSGDQGRGVTRRDESTLHLGQLINEKIASMEDSPARAELQAWFKHDAGFMCGLTPKGGPVPPMADGLTMRELASIIAH